MFLRTREVFFFYLLIQRLAFRNKAFGQRGSPKLVKSTGDDSPPWKHFLSESPSMVQLGGNGDVQASWGSRATDWGLPACLPARAPFPLFTRSPDRSGLGSHITFLLPYSIGQGSHKVLLRFKGRERRTRYSMEGVSRSPCKKRHGMRDIVATIFEKVHLQHVFFKRGLVSCLLPN